VDTLQSVIPDNINKYDSYWRLRDFLISLTEIINIAVTKACISHNIRGTCCNFHDPKFLKTFSKYFLQLNVNLVKCVIYFILYMQFIISVKRISMPYLVSNVLHFQTHMIVYTSHTDMWEAVLNRKYPIRIDIHFPIYTFSRRGYL